MQSRNLQNGKFSDDDDVPSAPPFAGGSTQEIKQAADSPASRAHSTQNTTDLPEMKTKSGTKPENKSGNVNSDNFVRCVLIVLFGKTENKTIC